MNGFTAALITFGGISSPQIGGAIAVCNVFNPMK
jgi:hypothetical protein